jgi:rhamnosyltransferase
MGNHIKVSVIIPTYNAGKQMRQLLSALKAQSEQCEILVIDSSSSDDTVEISASFGIKAIRIRKEEFDHGGTRNLAAGHANGKLLVFFTQDTLPVDENSVSNLVKSFEDPEVGAAFGRQLPYPDASPFGTHLRLFNYPEGSCTKSLTDKRIFGIKTPFLSNAFAAYRKSALVGIGGFRDRLILGEDTYAGAKLLLAGYKIAYAADALVYHSHNYTAFGEFKRYFDIGVFHKQERWIIGEFGRAEGEGINYMKSGAAFLMQAGKKRLLPEFIIRSGLKYLGYNMGRNYVYMPGWLRKRMSMHKYWWVR